MGLFSSRWQEVFFSTSAQSFFRGQNVLRELQNDERTDG